MKTIPLPCTLAMMAVASYSGMTIVDATNPGAVNPFIMGDVWRGMLTNCHQDVKGGVVMSDMTIESTGVDGTLRTIFTAPGRDIAYEMNGRFESASGRIRLIPGDWISEKPSYWNPCAVDGWLSKDLTTFSAVALCGDNMENICAPGGGEAILRHGRSQFLVSGAGEKNVNGVYKAGTMDDHRLNPDLYIEGAVYIQDGCASTHDGLDDDDCLHHVLIHKVLGQHRFWALCPLDNGEAGDAIYHAWSEDVEPPFSGWRPVDSMSRPPGVSFVADTVHLNEEIDPKSRILESGDYQYLVLVVFGILLWGAAIRLASTINVTSAGTKVKSKGGLVR